MCTGQVGIGANQEIATIVLVSLPQVWHVLLQHSVSLDVSFDGAESRAATTRDHHRVPQSVSGSFACLLSVCVAYDHAPEIMHIVY